MKELGKVIQVQPRGRVVLADQHGVRAGMTVRSETGAQAVVLRTEAGSVIWLDSVAFTAPAGSVLVEVD